MGDKGGCMAVTVVSFPALHLEDFRSQDTACKIPDTGWALHDVFELLKVAKTNSKREAISTFAFCNRFTYYQLIIIFNLFSTFEFRAKFALRIGLNRKNDYQEN